MKFKFDPNIDYQIDAVNSVIDLFIGNRTDDSNIAFNYNENNKIVSYRTVANKLNIDDNELLQNLLAIQHKNDIEQEIENIDSMDFTVEMETGTGKTYVYLRTIMELNKSYGMKKFIIVVPSVAIREGVIKTLEITKGHFRNIYDNVVYTYYEYDSGDLSRIKQFNRSNNIEIMVMTIDSFNKDSNIINRYSERIEGQKPIELVQDTRPILILDEPQNMESKKSKEALSNLNPLFKLRYSATHRNYYNLIYRLTPSEAYLKGLVKRIEVLSVVEDDDYSNTFIRVKDIQSGARDIKAKLDIYKKLGSGIKRGAATVYKGDNLFDKSNGIQEYSDFTVTEIDLKYNYIKFSNGIRLYKGDIQGIDRENLMKIQIERTVEEHFRKQYELKEKGIKVLSLFFIDRVNNYVSEDGFIRNTFIEAYNKIKNIPEDWARPYKDIAVEKVHAGYFAKNTQGDYYNDSSEHYMKQNNETFDLILKDKERLLSFEEPTQFIFSHSALREGWDNPNVFNICTLNESYSEIRKRQEIGRGVRIPVNQDGDRRFVADDNILTVVANESYKDFVAKLQIEYKDEFGTADQAPQTRNGRNRETVKLKSREELGIDRWDEFINLWDKISQKTRYRISFDKEYLKNACINEINNLTINNLNVRVGRIELELREKGIEYNFLGEGNVETKSHFAIKNFLQKIAEETQITKETIVDILSDVDNLDLIFKNPYQYISSVIEIINRHKTKLLINGIKYYKIDDKYEMSLFTDLKGYEKYLTEVDKSIYTHVIFDAGAEKRLAEKMEHDKRIKLFIKLPNWFKIDTPVGFYNPDWAIVVEDMDEQGQIISKLYLVRETKSIASIYNLHPSERQKIECGYRHFNEVFENINDANFEVSNVYGDINDLKELLKF